MMSVLKKEDVFVITDTKEKSKELYELLKKYDEYMYSETAKRLSNGHVCASNKRTAFDNSRWIGGEIYPNRTEVTINRLEFILSGKEELKETYFNFYDQLPYPLSMEAKTEYMDCPVSIINIALESLSDSILYGFRWKDDISGKKWLDIYENAVAGKYNIDVMDLSNKDDYELKKAINELFGRSPLIPSFPKENCYLGVDSKYKKYGEDIEDECCGQFYDECECKESTIEAAIREVQEGNAQPVFNNYEPTPDTHIRRFESGAVRSDDRGRIRFDYISPYALEAIAKAFTNHSNDFGATNYFKGIQPKDILPSLLRHENNLRISVMNDDKTAIKKEMLALATNVIMAIHQIELEERGEYVEIYNKTEYINKEEFLKDNNNK